MTTDMIDPLVEPPVGPAQPAEAASEKSLSKWTLYSRRFMRNKPAVAGVIILIVLVLFATLGPLLSPYAVNDMDFLSLGKGPSAEHWFGTNGAGNDTYTQTAIGLQRSLMIAITVSVGTTILSALVGTAAAYFGGWFERIALLVIHFMMVVPTFLMLSVISNDSGGVWWVIALVMIFIGWFFPARIIWTMTLSLREREYVQAARYMGVPGTRIVLRHLVPNIGSLLVINFTMGIVAAVTTETGLSFIGFGVKIPDVSLGSLIGEGSTSITSSPWLFYFPALALTLLTVSMALIADGLRDALDPTSAAGGRA